MKRHAKDTHIYFPPPLYEKIKKVAAKERRTISAEIVIAVEKHVKSKSEK